jgi:hypothetical protein
VSCAFKNRQSSGHVDEVFGTCTNKWADAIQFILVILWFFYSITLFLESCQLMITLLRFIPSTSCSQENKLKNKNHSNLKVMSNVESHAIDMNEADDQNQVENCIDIKSTFCFLFDAKKTISVSQQMIKPRVDERTKSLTKKPIGCLLRAYKE